MLNYSTFRSKHKPFQLCVNPAIKKIEVLLRVCRIILKKLRETGGEGEEEGLICDSTMTMHAKDLPVDPDVREKEL